MKVSIATLLAFSTSLLLSGCSMNRAASLRMLDQRAEYGDPRSELSPALREGGLEGLGDGPVPIRTRAKVAAGYIHPHEMANHDYFWGGWVSIVVEPDQWVLSKPGAFKPAKGVGDMPVGNVSAKHSRRKASSAASVPKK